MPSIRPAAAALVAATAIAGACAAPPPPAVAPIRAFERDTIVIAAPAMGAYVGSSIPLHATVWAAGLDSAANAQRQAQDGAPEITWETGDYRSAWVSDAGLLTLGKSGAVTVTARSGRLSTTRRFEVRNNPATRVTIAPAASRTTVGDTLRLSAAATAGATPVADAPIMWTVAMRGAGEPAAWVSPAGAFVASRPGVYTVIAESGGFADQRVVVVDGPTLDEAAVPASRLSIQKVDDDFGAYVGTSVRLLARAWRGEGGEGTPVTAGWASSDTAIAMVGPDGTVAFRKNGRVTITAWHGGREDTQRFNVGGNPAARVVLISDLKEVAAGDSVRFREDVWQPGGALVKNMRANYAVVAHGRHGPVPAVVTERRVFVAREPGVYTVIAHVGAFAASQTFEVKR